MAEKKGGLIWLWVLIGAGAVAAAGYGWYKSAQPKHPEEQVVALETSVSEQAVEAGTPDTRKSPQKDAVSSGSGTDNLSGKGDSDDPQGVRGVIDQKGLEAASASKSQAGSKKLPATGEIFEYKFASSRQLETENIPARDSLRGQADSPTKSHVRSPEMAAETTPAAYCNLINQHVRDFFVYLDTCEYIKQLDLTESAYARFKNILKRLSTRPPIPAGEGVDPAIMVKNIYFFCRALDKKDLAFVKDVLVHDQDTLEDNMSLLYQWAMLGSRCPNADQSRPAFDVLYRYAGFFLNTTGGRAYMFRRGLKVRLLVTFYCIQIIYQADKAGENIYGIDLPAYLRPLAEEMGHCPNLIYKENYMDTLSKIEKFYANRR